ncbi:MAG: ribosome biogenesis/translation initiation ATPase RLI [Thermoprotei archaeon]|nr:MAG: ribosome biogenesis/translation initiation ATPase RLI [Thermoprotei archaeon]
MRLAVIDYELCKPKYCQRQCIRFCPVVRTGSEAIKFDEELGRPIISEIACIGCGICIKKCPFKAITIVNLPEELEKTAIHRYGPNSFKLYGLPPPKPNKILGLIGENGVGKSTVLKILSGKIKPNLGRYNDPPEWDEIIRFFRGSELQNYFAKLSENQLQAVYKPQEIGLLPKYLRGDAKTLLEYADERGLWREIVEALNLKNILNKHIGYLSGGELQKLAIALAYVRDADIYMFDEPASFLDVRERLRIAALLRRLSEKEGKMVVLVEHDLAVLDYVSDYICILYGEPSVYGIVSMPRGTRVGINTYLKGYLKEENIRLRPDPIIFHTRPAPQEWRPETVLVSWSPLEISLNGFKLKVEGGKAHRGEVIGILGPNAIGKTTFIKTLAGIISPASGYIETRGKLKISYKPQFISNISYTGTLREYLKEEVGVDVENSYIKSEFINPLGLKKLLDREISTFSGGELQRAAIVSCLLQEADIYLLDEPMAFLDVEQRFAVAKLVKRITEEKSVVTFVVEHDVVAQDFMATSLMIFKGKQGESGYASAPKSLRKGMNEFLKDLEITFRRDLETRRPRINKPGSWLDRYQKEVLHEYYYIPEKGEED